MQMQANILELEAVTVGFDGFTVLNGLSLSMRRGELRFLIGPNGAGKTTLLDIITGKTRPTSGRVVIDGTLDVRRQDEHQLVRHGVARKFQTPTVFASLTVRENLEAAISFREGTPRLFTAVSRTHADGIAATLELIGLTRRSASRAGILSHGEKQWLEIGMLLVQEPKLLLLDEPVAGMTRRERDQTGALLEAITAERSVLVVEHDMEFVRRYARTVSVLHMGTLLCEGPMDVVQRDPRVIEVYLGRAEATERTPARERLKAGVAAEQ